MITFICFVLWKLQAPWWVYVLSIICLLSEFDTTKLAHRNDRINYQGKIIEGE